MSIFLILKQIRKSFNILNLLLFILPLTFFCSCVHEGREQVKGSFKNSELVNNKVDEVASTDKPEKLSNDASHPVQPNITPLTEPDSTFISEDIFSQDSVSSSVSDSINVKQNKKIEEGKEQTIEFKASDIDYKTEDHKIRLKGDAYLGYEKANLLADSIFFDSDTGILEAKGEPCLEDQEDRMAGSYMAYHLDSKKGFVKNGVTNLEDGIFEGINVRKVEENVLNIGEGHYSTCKLKTPHYFISGKKMKIYNKDKAIVKPMILYVQDVPVFYLPFGVISLIRGRHSGLLVPKYHEDFIEGRFLRDVGYYYAPSDYWDVLYRSDVYEYGRLNSNLELRYALRYKIPLSYLRLRYENNPHAELENLEAHLAHQQIIRQGFSLDFNADMNKRNDFSGRTEGNKNMNLNLYVRKDFGDFGNLAISTKTNRNYTQDNKVEEFPSLRFSRPWRSFIKPPLVNTEDEKRVNEKDKKWYHKLGYSYNTKFNNYLNKSPAQTTKYKYVDHVFDLSGRGLGLFDIVNISPSVSFEESWFNNRMIYSPSNPLGKLDWKYTARHTFTSSFTASSTLRGLFLPNYRHFKAALHTVDAHIGINYTPRFDRYFMAVNNGMEKDIYGSIIPTPGEKKIISFGLTNGLKIKWQAKDQEKRMDLMNVSINGQYNFLTDYQTQMNGEQHFSNLSISMRSSPSQAISMSAGTSYDPYKKIRDTINGSLSLSISGSSEKKSERTEMDIFSRESIRAEPQEKEKGTGDIQRFGRDSFYENLDDEKENARSWDVSLNCSLRIPRKEESSYTVNGAFSFFPTKKWWLRYSALYDGDTGDIVSQTLRVTRDLHCWEASFDWSKVGDNMWQYYILINVKKIPDIKVEKSEYRY